ncbi:MAG: Crp/Fnr family transcriptional regulator [Pseudomonadota bacterium]
MKLHDFFWDSPALDLFRKKAKSGKFLFEQGFPASSFIILTQGMVELVSSKNGQSIVVNYLGAGNVLGEQALVESNVFPRAFGARALGEVSYLEFEQKAIKQLHESSPQLVIEMLEATLRISNERIHRMNRLVQTIRLAHPSERFLYLLLHFSAYHGQPCQEGKAIVLNFETVNYYLDINSYQMEEMLDQLLNMNLIIKKSDTVFVIRDERELQRLIPKLKEELVPLDFL